MNGKILKICMVISVALLIALYACGLFVCENEFLKGPRYLTEIAGLSLLGTLTLLLSNKATASGKGWLKYLTIAFTFAWICYFPHITGRWSFFAWECAFVSLWPALCALLAKKLSEKRYVFIAEICIYNAISVLLIWLTEEWLFKSRYISADVIAEAYMFIIAQVAFVFLKSKKEKSEINKTNILIILGINIAVAAVWIATQERIRQIIKSLSYGKDELDFAGEPMNWLTHRKAMLDVSIDGRFSDIDPHYLSVEISRNSVAGLFAAGQPIIAVGIILAAIAVIVLMIMFVRKNCDSVMCQVLVSGFVLKFIIGSASNLLLFTTIVGIPFIRTAYDILPFILLVWACDKYKEQNLTTT